MPPLVREVNRFPWRNCALEEGVLGFHPLVVLEEPLQGRFVRAEFRNDFVRRKEPSLPPVQSFREAGSVEVKWYPGLGTGEAEAVSRVVFRKFVGRFIVFFEEFLPLFQVVVAEKIEGFCKVEIFPRLVGTRATGLNVLREYTVGRCPHVLGTDHFLDVIPQGYVSGVRRISVGRAELDGGVAPIPQQLLLLTQIPELLRKWVGIILP